MVPYNLIEFNFKPNKDHWHQILKRFFYKGRELSKEFSVRQKNRVNNISEKKRFFLRDQQLHSTSQGLTQSQIIKIPLLPKWNIWTYSIAQISWDCSIHVMVTESRHIQTFCVCNVYWEYPM